MAINYCHKIYHFKDADGLHSIGVEMMNDEMLLEEIINYGMERTMTESPLSGLH
jgi:hypothetical protein